MPSSLLLGYGFNPGSALLLNTENTGEVASLAAVNTTLSAASGAISALFAHAIFSTQATKELSLNLTKALNGSLAGLVAITAACGTVEPWAAALIGCIAGFVYLGASHFLVVLRLDDAVDGIPIHMFCGMWGLLATGLLSTPGGLEAAYGSDVHIGFLYSLGRAKPDATLLLNQFIAILFILGWTVGLMLPFFVALNRMGWLRADALEEIAGLDARYHHGVQENQEEIRQAIVQEYKRLKIPKSGKVAKGSRSNHSSSSNTPETMDDVSFQNFLNV